MHTISTFSIVARDPDTGELGVAVQSKFLSVGAMVPWAKAGAGAIATQANANLDYGEIGLKLLEKGYSARKVLDALLAELTAILHYCIFNVRTMGFRERGSLLFSRGFFHFRGGASRHDTAYSDP